MIICRISRKSMIQDRQIEQGRWFHSLCYVFVLVNRPDPNNRTWPVTTSTILVLLCFRVKLIEFPERKASEVTVAVACAKDSGFVKAKGKISKAHVRARLREKN